jgi:hypothetical protein
MARSPLPWTLAALSLAATALWMLLSGRPAWSPSGRVLMWYGDAWGPEGSQQLLDWYSPSHLIHGVLFFALLWLAARRLPLGWRFLIATLVECGWELLENSPLIIERYRTVTASREYLGDSVLNSASDVLCMMAGFALARQAPVWLSVAVVIGFEALTTAVIRDGLALNILMLLHPVEAVRAWQAVAAGG